jgi:hypothetical protein
MSHWGKVEALQLNGTSLPTRKTVWHRFDDVTKESVCRPFQSGRGWSSRSMTSDRLAKDPDGSCPVCVECQSKIVEAVRLLAGNG